MFGLLSTSYPGLRSVLERGASIGDVMRRPSPTLSLATALVAGACIGAGGGAATYAALSSGTTKTVVRQVTVEGSQPTANQSGLSVHEIYSRNYKGVVEITVTDQSVATPF